MPQNLTVNDYTFYIVSDPHGRYRFGSIRGTIHRKTHEQFAEMTKRLSPSMLELIVKLFGIASVENVQTGEHDLVFHLFEDLREGE